MIKLTNQTMKIALIKIYRYIVSEDTTNNEHAMQVIIL